jgi:hypothetical protein
MKAFAREEAMVSTVQPTGSQMFRQDPTEVWGTFTVADLLELQPIRRNRGDGFETTFPHGLA